MYKNGLYTLINPYNNLSVISCPSLPESKGLLRTWGFQSTKPRKFWANQGESQFY